MINRATVLEIVENPDDLRAEFRPRGEEGFEITRGSRSASINAFKVLVRTSQLFEGREEAVKKLRETLTKIRDAGLRISPATCKLTEEQIFMLSEGLISRDVSTTYCKGSRIIRTKRRVRPSAMPEDEVAE